MDLHTLSRMAHLRYYCWLWRGCELTPFVPVRLDQERIRARQKKGPATEWLTIDVSGAPPSPIRGVVIKQERA